MNETEDTYVYKIFDGNEVVKYGITSEPRDRENHYWRRKERGWYNLTDFIIIEGPTSKEEAKKSETKHIKDHEKKHGKKPRYNKNYSTTNDDEDDDIS